MPTKEEIREENQRIRRLRILTNLTISIIMQSNLTLEEASKLVADVRSAVMKLFPGKEDVFDLVLAPRFRRVINERFHLQ
ncbi:MAG: hypothetical protein JRG73_15240 [Deltaproteobacteria bacterium]|nr:hypothetical protein [Deltaproteobacteria bacterium]MBW2308279.1 hypothetical protein [Deltaproteobacteria bacterium]